MAYITCPNCCFVVSSQAKFCLDCGVILQSTTSASSASLNSVGKPAKNFVAGRSVASNAVPRFDIFNDDVRDIFSKVSPLEKEDILIAGKLRAGTDFAMISLVPVYFNKTTSYIVVTDRRIVYGLKTLWSGFTKVISTEYATVREVAFTIKKEKTMYFSSYDMFSKIDIQFVNGNVATLKTSNHDFVRAISEAISPFVAVKIET